MISINVSRVQETGRKFSSVLLTFDQELFVCGKALCVHLVVFQTRIDIVPERDAASRAEDGLEIGLGVGAQLASAAKIPQVRDFVGVGGRDHLLGREEEVQELAHFGCSGGVSGQLQFGTFRVWRGE